MFNMIISLYHTICSYFVLSFHGQSHMQCTFSLRYECAVIHHLRDREIYAPRGRRTSGGRSLLPAGHIGADRSEAKTAGIRFGRCQLTLTRIPHQVSRARLEHSGQKNTILCKIGISVEALILYTARRMKQKAGSKPRRGTP